MKEADQKPEWTGLRPALFHQRHRSIRLWGSHNIPDGEVFLARARFCRGRNYL